ncbi:preprotein translocase subunit SecY [Botrimarina mediterranea]|uniref:Protein translocase subunit SecY n=1 Tax=Botrimarina mediterranea TaxID=2528022 RepID=A0A518KEK4_9BACT|nr:preprotein translocase subunit SecY [Botrimarina mediterranea]QDV76224.1 Protein translocase subunit SecY [Botrimarina mediterranea]QDV80822.1 Protein translocase subunit SecY [Planctomycetes bacterium K2D]
MFEKLRVVWQIPELRKKILLTLFLLGVYRVGFQISLPIVDTEKIQQFQQSQGGLNGMLQQVAILSASKLNDITIFGLGIMPYISASIIFQLLGSVIPSLEALQKEGEAGRKKINEYTRYATVFLCLIQSWFFVTSFANSQGLVSAEFVNSATGNMYLGWTVVSVLTMTAGTIFLMWLGEQIDEYGIGNGISLLIMAGILAQMPYAGLELYQISSLTLGDAAKLDPPRLMLLAAMFIGVVVGTVFITLGQRRITMQSAKHQRGRRVVGGGKSYLPLKVNQAGVMPIIFASSLLMFPGLFLQQLDPMVQGWDDGFWKSLFSGLAGAFNQQSFFYNLLFLVLIYFFCYFWTAITFNPKDMSENLKNFGSFIPGYRPGKRTADYLEKVMFRITYVGAGFLALIAIIPSLIVTGLNVPWGIAMFYGGTSLLIAVSVAFDLVQKIDSHLVMRNYKGLLE